MSKRSPDRPRRVTMSDVARRAGVSQPTVSFVLNDRRDVVVAEETRRRVLAAAAEMDFVPNRAAQHLRSNRSYLIGVVANGIVSQPYAGRIILGIQQVVQPADHLCLAIDTTDDPEQGDVAVANLLATGVAAIVYASPAPRELHRSHRLDHTRTLFVNCWPDEGQVETVVLADEYHGGLAAAQAAFELGHRDVAFLGGYQGEFACVERHRGFLDAAQAASIDPAVLVQRYGNYSISSGYNLTVQVLAEHRPTAIVCGNDRMAIGSLLALHSLGLDCPTDVSVIGFDDQPDVADQVRPSLTTVELPHLLMGRRAGELLLAEPTNPIERMTMPCTLIRRDSLGPPRPADAGRAGQQHQPRNESEPHDSEHQMTVHFRPPGGYVGDLIPFERDGQLWLFYLLDERRDPPTGMPWALASTEDFVNYTDHGVVLPSGGADAADYDCYTGCVIDDGDQLHLFYTGHNPNRRSAAGDLQVVCHATSDGDLTQWYKEPDHTFGAPTGYLPEDWRDPYVYRVAPNEPWQMILAARHTERPDRRRGVVARLTSTDLVIWRPTTPLWDPHRYITQECPEVFQWGNWWYLVYSEFSDAFQTRYRIAAGPDGPWLAPERDSVDGRARYASKSVARGDRRFFLGWIATRASDRDDGDWEWAGELAALEATQEADGTLGFGLPPELVASFAQSETVQLVPVDGAAADPGRGATDRFAAWLGPTLPDPCLVTATLDIAPGTQLGGLLLRTDDTAETGYELRLEPGRSRVVFDRWPRGHTGPAQWQARGDVPYAVELERPCPLPPGRHTVQVLLDGSVFVAVVDNRVALSTRLYDHPSGRVGLFTCDGEASLNELSVAVRP